MIQLEQVTKRILTAVKKLNPNALDVEDNKLLLTLADPQKQNPDYVQAIVAAGGRIQYVTQLAPGLEETYLKVIEETK